jgi:site-specific DNA recombinase
MKEDIKSGKIQAVIVYRIDRLARSTSIILSQIEEFNKYGIAFISVNENIETTTANGLFFITMLGAIATLERTNNSEKMTA